MSEALDASESEPVQQVYSRAVFTSAGNQRHAGNTTSVHRRFPANNFGTLPVHERYPSGQLCALHPKAFVARRPINLDDESMPSIHTSDKTLLAAWTDLAANAAELHRES